MDYPNISTHPASNGIDVNGRKGSGADHNSSQISNVDFGTLRKIGTNMSQASAISNSSVKSNPLSRLFTRNKSQTNVLGRNPEGEFVNAPDPTSDSSTIESGKESKINKLRAAKKILSPTSKSQFESSSESSFADEKSSNRRLSDEIRGRKQILTSPSSGFHSLFHKSSSASGLPKFGDKNVEDKLHSGSAKVSICLSSNNSNSVVNDIMLARVFRFTNPSIQNEDYDGGLAEHTSLLDIHRKMLTPADSYIQNKLSKHHSQEIGLGIVNKNAIGQSPSLDEELKLNRSSQRISTLLKPLFTPSKQKRSSFSSHPFLGHSLDEVGVMIKNHFTAELNGSTSSDQNQKSGKHRIKSNKSISKGQVSGLSGGESFSIAALDEDEARGLAQDLATIFMSCLSWLKCDITNAIDLDSNNESTGSDASNVWQSLSKSWVYYNKNIRFQILQIFQVVFAAPRSYTGGKFVEQRMSPIVVDEILQHSFCIVFIVPLIETRKRFSTESLNFDVASRLGMLSEQERHLFRQNPSLQTTALHCIGSLQSLPQSSYFKPDVDLQHLQQLMREIVANLSDLS
ncbi:hypothetical protein KGF57_004107 [Candida theae]|uniref:Uncharacterized protein n=1 Tax=Candida theae TaxID=1198502 RepID=A0AAD5FXF4_9ASCO|nr:uncharacterized protein KGF57_004107 [Candida theae]KAI5952965.1 hypothetical protein KGF57_004107 [Candida theae]